MQDSDWFRDMLVGLLTGLLISVCMMGLAVLTVLLWHYLGGL